MPILGVRCYRETSSMKVKMELLGSESGSTNEWLVNDEQKESASNELRVWYKSNCVLEGESKIAGGFTLKAVWGNTRNTENGVQRVALGGLLRSTIYGRESCTISTLSEYIFAQSHQKRHSKRRVEYVVRSMYEAEYVLSIRGWRQFGQAPRLNHRRNQHGSDAATRFHRKSGE